MCIADVGEEVCIADVGADNPAERIAEEEIVELVEVRIAAAEVVRMVHSIVVQKVQQRIEEVDVGRKIAESERQLEELVLCQQCKSEDPGTLVEELQIRYDRCEYS